MKLHKKTIIFLGVASLFTFVASVAYTSLFFVMKNKTEETAVLLEKINEISGRDLRIASSASLLKRESANIEKVQSSFFKESDIVIFAKNIETLGEQSGTTLSIESLEQGLNEKKAPFLTMRIRAIGEFSNIESLLLLIENYPGKFEWKSVRLVRDASASESTATGAKSSKVVTVLPKWRAEISLAALNFTN